jgi:LysR family carnitine catabolism transcriptional activator
VHLSPSGMSMMVKELEDQLGARLFDRTTRSVSLTEAGRRLQPVAERIVGELHAVQAAIGGDEASAQSRLRIAATPMVSASVLPDVINAFALKYPSVQLELADVDVSVVRQRVLDEEADIGLGFFVKPAVGLLRQPLCKFRLMRISPPAPQAKGLAGSQAWSSLAELPLISLPVDNPIQAVIEKELAAIGRANEQRPRMNLLGTLIAMVRAGRGHAIVPSFALDECLRQGLQVAMLSKPAVQIELYVVSLRGTQAKPAALAFTAAVKKAASRLSG